MKNLTIGQMLDFMSLWQSRGFIVDVTPSGFILTRMRSKSKKNKKVKA